MKFTKSFDAANVIPADGIKHAVELMENGMLYRYGEVDEQANSADAPYADKSEVSKLELEFGRYTGHKYVVAVNSCGSAMFISLKAMGIQPGDKVFTNAFTFTAVPSSIVHACAEPVYVECTDQYIIDMGHFEQQIKQQPDVKYFIVSHMRGHIAQMDEIKSLCDEHNIRLIEDCAHGLGKRWDPQGENGFVGHHGETACYSTQSHKILNAGEGGFIATNDEQFAAYCILAAGSYEGLYKKHLARPDDAVFEDIKFSVPNFSLRMNNLTAAILRPQIKLIDQRIDSYKQKHQRLIELLSDIECIHIPEAVAESFHVGDSLQFNLQGLSEAQVVDFLSRAAADGVKIQVFGSAENARDFRNWQYSFEEMPAMNNTADIIDFACDLRLPMNFDMQDIELIAEVIQQVVADMVVDTPVLARGVAR